MADEQAKPYSLGGEFVDQSGRVTAYRVNKWGEPINAYISARLYEPGKWTYRLGSQLPTAHEPNQQLYESPDEALAALIARFEKQP